MNIVNHRRWFFTLSLLLVLGSIFTLIKFGLRWGADFTGGAILEVAYLSDPDGPSQSGGRPELATVRASVVPLNLGEPAIQAIGENGYLLRLRTIEETEHQELNQALRALAPESVTMTEIRFSSVGPALGAELARRGLWASVLVVILIILYIAFVFRRVSKPVNSWIYGLTVIVMMFHDALIPTGVFALLGYYRGVEADTLFLTAFLTILGLSVNDKIVALDRIRENLRRQVRAETFAQTVGRSISETLTRSVNTSVTVILVLLAIFWFGAESTRYFALAMALGMVVATYSSVFVAAPLLVSWETWRRRGKDRVKN